MASWRFKAMTASESATSDDELIEVTQWLHAWSDGDQQARERLFAWVYPIARAIAGRRLSGVRDPDLSATQLAHEAFMRLLTRPAIYAHRGHFLNVFAVAVRHELIDHIRRAQSDKHGGGAQIVTEGQIDQLALELIEHHESLHDALNALGQRDARKRQVIEMHYFLGLDRAEVAQLLEVSLVTVDRDLAFSRAWLKAELADTRA
jgi:RNA polymerase sigma factor (TIGR02999 family)